jgi:hypothetical protein
MDYTHYLEENLDQIIDLEVKKQHSKIFIFHLTLVSCQYGFQITGYLVIRLTY